MQRKCRKLIDSFVNLKNNENDDNGPIVERPQALHSVALELRRPDCHATDVCQQNVNGWLLGTGLGSGPFSTDWPLATI